MAMAHNTHLLVAALLPLHREKVIEGLTRDWMGRPEVGDIKHGGDIQRVNLFHPAVQDFLIVILYLRPVDLSHVPD
eukprot:scaffold1611_cov175-Ochromonas_danica.AAC.2